MFHMNICSLRKKHLELTALFEILKGDFDCIILTEAHLKPGLNVKQYVKQFGFEGYESYGSEHNVRKTDGVVCFVKSSLEHEVKEINIADANCLLVEVKKKNFSLF